MLNTLRRYFASCELDRRPSRGGGEFTRVHGLLSQHESAPRQAPSPALRSRIMDELRRSPAPSGQTHRGRWALAAAACVMLGVAAVPLLRPAPPAGPSNASFSGISIPMGATPVYRLVAGSVDQPLLDQARKMYSDTQRATRAVVHCVPFGRGG